MSSDYQVFENDGFVYVVADAAAEMFDVDSTDPRKQAYVASLIVDKSDGSIVKSRFRLNANA